MQATITNKSKSPKAFYIGHKSVQLVSGESISGDYDDALLLSLKKTGFDVDHKGALKVGEAKAAGKSDLTKAEAEKILADARAEAEKIVSEAKAQADKIIAEADELAKAGK